MRLWTRTHRAAGAVTILLLAAVAPCAGQAAPGATPEIPPATRAAIDRLIDAAVRDSFAYQRLGELVDTYGNRLSGSEALEHAFDWALAKMKADGLDNVHAEPVMVPHWVRGPESAELIRPRRHALHMLGLGGSVGTPRGGITAPVLVVGSFDELTRRAAEAKGKIVLFDFPSNRALPPFKAYCEAVQYRVNGPSAAARVGAKACLIRSVASFSIQSPHTGVMHYDSTVARIPAAALSVEDAELLHRLQDRGEPVVVRGLGHLNVFGRLGARDVLHHVSGREIQPSRGELWIEFHSLLEEFDRFGIRSVTEGIHPLVELVTGPELLAPRSGCHQEER